MKFPDAQIKLFSLSEEQNMKIYPGILLLMKRCVQNFPSDGMNPGKQESRKMLPHILICEIAADPHKESQRNPIAQHT